MSLVHCYPDKDKNGYDKYHLKYVVKNGLKKNLNILKMKFIS